MRLDDSYLGLTQWDTGRKIVLDQNELCDQVHFSNKSFGKTVDVKVYQLNNSYIADIPDELLQSPSPLTAYCYVVRDDGETTTISETFPVRKRNKPTEYIYNPDDQTRIKEFNDFVDDTIDEMNKIKDSIDSEIVDKELEIDCLQYYGNNYIRPSDENYFTVNETGETITGLTNEGKTQTKIVVPYKINDVYIIKIGDSVFKNMTSLTDVILPETITDIGDDAFYNCTRLLNITMPQYLTRIGAKAFYGDSEIRKLYLANTLVSIGDQALDGVISLYCEPLTEAYRFIYDNQLNKTATVHYIDILADLRNDKGGFSGGQGASGSYGGAAGRGATATSGGAAIGANANTDSGAAIGNSAISKNGGAAIGLNAKSSGGGAIGVRAQSLQGGAIGVDSITGSGFAGGNKAKTVAVDGTTAIDAIQLGTGTNTNYKTLQVYNYQLMDASGNIPSERLNNATLKEVTERLQYYGDKDIVPSNESWFTVNETGETITGLTDEGKTQTELVIPYKINDNIITSIGQYAFAGTYYGTNSTVTSIILPNSIARLEKWAFIGCESLISVNIPDSVTFMGDRVFSRCISLKDIFLPNSIISMGERVFELCKSLTHITIPDSITSINKYTFSVCESLISIEIPNTIKKINEGAFSGCKSLTVINLPNSITSLGNYAFYECGSLKYIEMPNSITRIGKYTFCKCTSLRKIKIPNSIISIDDQYAFYGIIPSNLTVYCEKGSYAETYSINKGFNVVYNDIDKDYFNNYVSKDGSNTISGTIDVTTGSILVSEPTSDTQAANKKYVDDSITAGIQANDAMTFKGLLGGEGNITELPTDVTTIKNGDTYKVAVDGTYNEISAKAGDMFISLISGESLSWQYIPSADDGNVLANNDLTKDALMVGNDNKEVKTLANGSNDQILRIANNIPIWEKEYEVVATDSSITVTKDTENKQYKVSVAISPAGSSAITARSANVMQPIVPGNLNFAVKAALSDANRISDMTDEERANARSVIEAASQTELDTKLSKKADAWTIYTAVTNNTLILADKTETQLLSSDTASLTLTTPTTIPNSYECAFSFKSGATATTLVYAATPITWRGTDCDADGDFTPQANVSYEVSIKCLGMDADNNPVVVARVGAF